MDLLSSAQNCRMIIDFELSGFLGVAESPSLLLEEQYVATDFSMSPS